MRYGERHWSPTTEDLRAFDCVGQAIPELPCKETPACVVFGGHRMFPVCTRHWIEISDRRRAVGIDARGFRGIA